MEEVILNETEVVLLNEADRDIQECVERKRQLATLIFRARRLEGGYDLSKDNTRLTRPARPEAEPAAV